MYGEALADGIHGSRRFTASEETAIKSNTTYVK